jgi:nicotinate-nucleotide adenylyltransferase
MGARQMTQGKSKHPATRGGRRPRISPTRQTGVRAGLRYGILGGTFDPPHLGHLALAQEVYTRLSLDRLWFLPAREPPHKTGRPISSPADRLAMLERAIASDERFAVSTVELERPGPSYTVDTLGELRTLWGADAWLALILGWDMLAYLPNWRDAAGVIARTDQIVATHRPGVVAAEGDVARLEEQLPGLREKLTLLPAPQLAVSGTEIRTRVVQMLPVRYLTPDAVATYIEMRALYRVRNQADQVDQAGGAGR